MDMKKNFVQNTFCAAVHTHKLQSC